MCLKLSLCVCVCEDLITLSVQFDELQVKRYQPECLCVCECVCIAGVTGRAISHT